MKINKLIRLIISIVLILAIIIPSFSVVSAAAPTDDYGNTDSSAKEIEADSNIAGNINYSGDVDYFKFIPDVTGSYCISSTGTTDLYGYLYNKSNTLITLNDDASSSDSNVSITANLIAGQTYYIKIKHYNASQTGVYGLGVRAPAIEPVNITSIEYVTSPIYVNDNTEKLRISLSNTKTSIDRSYFIDVQCGRNGTTWYPKANSSIGINAGYTSNYIDVPISFSDTGDVYTKVIVYNKQGGTKLSERIKSSVDNVLSQGKPDLVITDIVCTPSNPVVGNKVSFKATIKNQGDVPTPTGKKHSVSFQVDGVEYAWSNNYTSSIAPGASVTVAANGGPNSTSTWTATLGRHDVRAYVDGAVLISENNENNNTSAITLVTTDTSGENPPLNFWEDYLDDLIIESGATISGNVVTLNGIQKTFDNKNSWLINGRKVVNAYDFSLAFTSVNVLNDRLAAIDALDTVVKVAGNTNGFVSSSSTSNSIQKAAYQSTSKNVKNIQLVLKQQKFWINSDGTTSNANATNFFGTITRASLIKFQTEIMHLAYNEIYSNCKQYALNNQLYYYDGVYNGCNQKTAEKLSELYDKYIGGPGDSQITMYNLSGKPELIYLYEVYDYYYNKKYRFTVEPQGTGNPPPSEPTITQTEINNSFAYFKALKQYNQYIEDMYFYSPYINLEALREWEQSMLYIEFMLLQNTVVKSNSSVSTSLSNSLKSGEPIRGQSIDSLMSTLKNSNSSVNTIFNQLQWEEDSVLLTMIVNLIPGIGDGKGVWEGLTGIDTVTGDTLAWWERALGFVCLSELRSVGNFSDALRTANNADDILRDMNRLVDAVGKVAYEANKSTGGVIRKISEMGVDEYLRLEDIADNMYISFRSSVVDITAIAQKTGWEQAKITQIKNHLFNEQHLFQDGTRKVFDPDYEQAMAWDRMIKGTHNEKDLLLLNHELFESNYIKAHNCSYEVAHAEANKLYNWQSKVYPE